MIVIACLVNVLLENCCVCWIVDSVRFVCNLLLEFILMVRVISSSRVCYW